MKISVVINTLNRPEQVSLCLESLRLQTYKDFEVIVVDQSRNRRTKEVCKPYNLKYYRIKKRNNLSISRNFGINMAAGEIVAFIDDDAQAKEDWIERISNHFLQDDKPGFIAGRVIDVSDSENPVTQFQNGIVSAFGYSEDIRPTDEKRYQRGHAGWYVRPMGANMVFQKKSLEKIGGFDEFYEYIHDETDVAVRVIKSGDYGLYDDSLIVYHNPALGRNRKRKRFSTNWYALTKNNIYFALKNGSGILPLRVLRSFWRVLGARGPFIALFKLFLHRKISIFSYMFGNIRSGLGLLKGFFWGTRKKRKLMKVTEPSAYLLFAKRHG
ncbi:MAG: glycosyltransferase [Candidatus Dojkabacteria bacterium]|uniref:Hyaluronan synthase n=2 Tax=Candidatus Dojkabacteria TaxID=74243 RepID=A0A136KG39_9BACT|nr:MAG: Hyaluronan synthase [candidate division WS6 bacterium OLB21]MBW7953791.1 glycosyltransferase family 2 protein [Candidatus Dojkabacteria bacterium]WKZ27640.1 MAG: glycosyltransferase [Candidatus Dojkabacteria bacterium]